MPEYIRSSLIASVSLSATQAGSVTGSGFRGSFARRRRPSDQPTRRPVRAGGGGPVHGPGRWSRCRSCRPVPVTHRASSVPVPVRAMEGRRGPPVTERAYESESYGCFTPPGPATAASSLQAPGSLSQTPLTMRAAVDIHSAPGHTPGARRVSWAQMSSCGQTRIRLHLAISVDADFPTQRVKGGEWRGNAKPAYVRVEFDRHAAATSIATSGNVTAVLSMLTSLVPTRSRFCHRRVGKRMLSRTVRSVTKTFCALLHVSLRLGAIVKHREAGLLSSFAVGYALASNGQATTCQKVANSGRASEAKRGAARKGAATNRVVCDELVVRHRGVVS